MNWKQHLAIGITLSSLFTIIMAWKFGWFRLDGWDYLKLLVVVFVSGLVPDLDHESGKLGQWLTGLGLLSSMVGLLCWLSKLTILEDFSKILLVFGIILAFSVFFAGEFAHHRGFWHSIPFCLIYGVIVGLLTWNYQIGIVGFLGCYSHLLADKQPFKFK